MLQRTIKGPGRSGQTCSEGEATLALMLRAEGIPFRREFRAVPTRKFRWDFFIAPDLLIEVQGGVWNGGLAHSSGKGITRDAEKASLATAHGFRHITATTVETHAALAQNGVLELRR